MRVLIADDEGFVRGGLIKNISWSELGVTAIEQASDGVQALELASRFQPDILITDVRMPRMDGIELARRMKELRPHCRLIFMSAYSDKEYLKSAISLNAVGYVEKPINLIEISEAIANALELCAQDERRLAFENQSRQSLQESLQILKSNAALELLHGNSNPALVIKCLNTAGVMLDANGWFCAALFNVRRKGRPAGALGMEEGRGVLTATEECFRAIGLEAIASFRDSGSMIVIAGSADTRRAEKEMLIRQACLEALRTLGDRYEVFAAPGKVAIGADGIPQSCKAAIEAGRQLFYAGYNAVAQPAGRLPGEPPRAGAAERFDELLNLGKKTELISALQAFGKDLRLHEHMAPGTVRQQYYHILQQLLQAARNRNIRIGTELGGQALLETLLSMETLDDLEGCLLGCIDSYFAALDRLEGVSRTVSDIIGIITAQYANPALSIKTICDTLCFYSHSYLCVIFKAATGKTINQYITDHRMEKARELLRDRNIKLYVIAGLAGYSDQNYFTKVFKKAAGMTPSEYRERHA